MKKTIYNRTTLSIFIILILILFVIISFFISRQICRVSYKKAVAIVSKQGISEDRIIQIGGISQFINIRGENTNNPVILVIHGGPGTPIFAMSYLYQLPIEKDYTVINWDQRNSGKTYYLNKDKYKTFSAELSLDTYIKDLKELVMYIRNNVNEKIIILGHSWGSVLGALFVSEYPNLVSAYVGVGQSVCVNKGEIAILSEMRTQLQKINITSKSEYSEELENPKALENSEELEIYEEQENPKAQWNS